MTREDANEFYQRWYTPNNAILVVAGDVTVDQVKPLAEKYFGPIAPRPVPAAPAGRRTAVAAPSAA